ncbi:MULTISPECIES: TerD family protein [Streptomyces]|uniref:TerD family protein n=2 Tax=Streptomyces TaxID=1883 RepID=A0A3R7I5U7_9ACTN|nr:MULTISPECIES: TerD family protein [Streptomyces]KNE83519.1 stress response protein, TerZ- and CABP1 [Streptomyces fradiae]OFA62019.1 stress response protein TerZ [Streptomyces fradiae]PQM24604.1 TerD family protein [Streptomyces xinghaiensis]RKM97477.1 TerD family protein [Streptomyces xinghaiensis]RNC75632.1 TerD family protein [Streptomyces xinghaiensis]
MVKGANVGLAALSEDTGAVVLSLSWCSTDGDGDADVSVLLLDANGKVRGDADFLFYNNPVAADGSVQLLGKTPTANGSEDRISLDLSVMPPEVERVVLAASRYGGARFGDLDDLRMTLADRTGETVLGFSIDDASVESAFLFGELYRRAGEWKFRAVGQGYETGLEGLATDFGIDVDEAPEEESDAPGAAEETGGPVPDTAAVPPAEGAAPAPAPVPPAATAPAPVPGTAVPPRPSTTVPSQRPAPEAATATATAAEAPAPAPAPAPAGGPAPAARRPRTAKKKVTIPRTAKKSLAENDTWRQARLFPAPALKSDRERETRATSVLLSVMAQVPEFGRRLTAGFGAPAGRTETFAEVSLPHGDTPRRPDGIIRVERAGKLWTALVETKTNGNPLKPAQVQDYMDIAARRGYEAVITLSNDVALEGRPLVDVKIDKRRKHKVALWHLSWAEVAHQAQMLIRHEGVGNAAHAWLLQELLHYLQHDNSGCHGFQNMGPAWVPVRKGIDEETLCEGDRRAVEVVESWERLVRQVCLRLGGELGQKVLPVQRAKRGTDPDTRRAALADSFCRDGRLSAELRVDGAQGVLGIVADLRTGKLRTSVEMPAPDQGYPLTWAKRLIRQLAEAPADTHIETLVDGRGAGPRGTLERLRPEPADILPKDGAAITGFRLSLFKGMGSTRGSAESGFIRSVDDAVDRFYAGVVAHLDTARAGRRSQSAAAAGAVARAAAG